MKTKKALKIKHNIHPEVIYENMKIRMVISWKKKKKRKERNVNVCIQLECNECQYQWNDQLPAYSTGVFYRFKKGRSLSSLSLYGLPLFTVAACLAIFSCRLSLALLSRVFFLSAYRPHQIVQEVKCATGCHLGGCLWLKLTGQYLGSSLLLTNRKKTKT